MSPILGFHGEYRFLSNFWMLGNPTIQEIDGILLNYPSVEHAYQASKTLILSERMVIANSYSPGIAKRNGRRVTCHADWDAVKIDTLRHFLQVKFQDPVLRQKLIDTQGRGLYEVNAHNDVFWGCDADLIGESWLGQLLMELRDEILKSI